MIYQSYDAAVLKGRFDHVEFKRHSVFGMQMPKTCPGTPGALLNPRCIWTDEET